MATDLMEAPAAVAPSESQSLIVRFANKHGVEPGKMLATLKRTCFKTERELSNEQMAVLLMACEANNLNPFLRQLYALLDKSGGVVPYVGYDGWIALVNRQPEFDGVQSVMSSDFSSCTTTMWRKDRAHPFEITEYLAEVKRNSTPWSTSPKRMLRIRSYVQCARLTFGFPGLHDEYSAREIAFDRTGPALPPGVYQAGAAARAARILQPAPGLAADPVDTLDDDYVPPAKSLAAWMDEVLHAPDAETAALVVDEARDVLDPPQKAELAAAYTSKWNPKE